MALIISTILSPDHNTKTSSKEDTKGLGANLTIVSTSAEVHIETSQLTPQRKCHIQSVKQAASGKSQRHRICFSLVV